MRENAVLKFYVRSPTPEEKATVGMIKNAKKTVEEVHEMTPQDVLGYDSVIDAWADESGFYIKTNTVDSIQYRNLAEEIQIGLEISIIDENHIPR